VITSPLLTTIPGLFHGFGTRSTEDPVPGLLTVKQVHGTYVYYLGEDREIEKPGYDILMTHKRGTAIGIKTADCLPVLMVEPEKGIIAAVHAGWKGTLSGVLKKAVTEMIKRGGDVTKMAASLGPAISGSCYEIEKDVAGLFEKEFSNTAPFLKRKSETKWLLDLAELNRVHLLDLGVRPERIDRIDLCTHCRGDLFPSYRRDGKGAGRMVSFIKLL